MVTTCVFQEAIARGGETAQHALTLATLETLEHIEQRHAGPTREATLENVIYLEIRRNIEKYLEVPRNT